MTVAVADEREVVAGALVHMDVEFLTILTTWPDKKPRRYTGMAGVHIVTTEDKAIFTVTDGRRLARVTAPCISTTKKLDIILTVGALKSRINNPHRRSGVNEINLAGPFANYELLDTVAFPHAMAIDSTLAATSTEPWITISKLSTSALFFHQALPEVGIDTALLKGLPGGMTLNFTAPEEGKGALPTTGSAKGAESDTLNVAIMPICIQ